MRVTVYQMEINPHLPDRLMRLNELANNLWYSWDRPTRRLFAGLDSELWTNAGHSPKAFLKRVSQYRLSEAAEDAEFLSNFNRVLSAFDSYCSESPRAEDDEPMGAGDFIAYFSPEFGFDESLPIYSGGLGILAGDHCKAASDLMLPFVGVGLLYRQGYFAQTIDVEGRQHAIYSDSDFDDLPVTPVQVGDGRDLQVSVPLMGRNVVVKVWKTRIGRVELVLLDTDVEENSPHDRDIAHRLYGGDRTTRIEQEIILGVGGKRALDAMRLHPTVWHINEGHAAFLVLERIRQLVLQGLEFTAALEASASNMVFTTHTAVPAGHDHFSEEMILGYFESWCRDVKVRGEDLLALGWDPNTHDFNMTALAIRGSRLQNGVSRIHGTVSAQICRWMWPQIEPAENPVQYVTNGVHIPTFLSEEWHELFNRHLGPGWMSRLGEEEYQRRIRAIPDHLFWSVHQSRKAQLLHLLRYRIARQHTRNQGSEAHLDRMFKFADPINPNVLTIGFARRFATYKRATLLFEDLDRLHRIVSNPQQPVLIIFAGKAHPADQPGQAFLRRVVEIANMPAFEGHILLVEGYDLHLARRLTSGVDVWLNNPVYPLEACGTSGMKAGMNGVINLSVLDGWWGEAYDGCNGWAIKPASETLDEGRRAQEEARALYEILQDSVQPLFYNLGPAGYSAGWVAMAKQAMISILPRFNAVRMASEYLKGFYRPAAEQWSRYTAADFEGARHVAAWKAKVRAAWQRVTLRRIDTPLRRLSYGDSVRFEVAVHLDGLVPEDIVVALFFGRHSESNLPHESKFYRFRHEGKIDGRAEDLYVLDLKLTLCGKAEYRICAYPYHELLTHRYEMGMMTWL